MSVFQIGFMILIIFMNTCSLCGLDSMGVIFRGTQIPHVLQRSVLWGLRGSSTNADHGNCVPYKEHRRYKVLGECSSLHTCNCLIWKHGSVLTQNGFCCSFLIIALDVPI